MADDPTQGIPMHPALDQFRQMFTTPESKSWADDQAVKINDYLVQKGLALDGQKAADNAVQNIDQFRSGLVNAVSRDPQFVHTALDLVPHHIGTMIGNDPYHPDEERQNSHDAITGDIQNQIATSAIRSLASHDEGRARDLLNHPNISSTLSDQDKSGLSDYIDMQTIARGADQAAQGRLQADRAALTETLSAIGHAARLHDAGLDYRQFPGGWAQSVVADPKVGPQARADLLNLYGRMQTTGDAIRSDPFLVADTVRRAAEGQPPPVDGMLREAGKSLKLGDALWLAAQAVPKTTEGKDYLTQVDAHIQAAKQQLMPNGPSDLAGQASFGKFMDWFMPRITSSKLDLNPASKGYFNSQGTALNQFHSNLPIPQTRVGETRPSLAEIFGGKK